MLLLASSVCGLFKWRQFEPEVILLAVGWYLRFSLSYRDVEELLAERGLLVDHVTVWRWVQRYAPEIQRRLRLRLRPTNDSWRMDETYIRIKGEWRYLYRVVDSTGATIDFLLSAKRDAAAAQRFLAKALGRANHPVPRVINTDKHAAYPKSALRDASANTRPSRRFASARGLPETWLIWTLSKLGPVRKLRRVPAEKIVLAELAEAQRQLETELASSGLADASSAFMRNAYHRLQTTAQQWTQRKAEQLEVTRAMLTELRNEIRAATSSIRRSVGFGTRCTKTPTTARMMRYSHRFASDADRYSDWAVLG